MIGGICVVLMATVMSSSVSVLNRSLKTMPLSVILFYQAFVGVCVSLFLLIVSVVVGGRRLYFLDFSPFQNSLLFLGTGLGALALSFNTVAFQAGTSSFVSLFNYMNVCYALLAEFIIFHENFNVTEIVCCGVIVGICFLVGAEKIRVEKVKQNLTRMTEMQSINKL